MCVYIYPHISASISISIERSVSLTCGLGSPFVAHAYIYIYIHPPTYICIYISIERPVLLTCGLGSPFVAQVQPTTCSVFIFSMISSHRRSGVWPLGIHSLTPPLSGCGHTYIRRALETEVLFQRIGIRKAHLRKEGVFKGK